MALIGTLILLEYGITTASSVAAAREIAENACFDLVISDVGLPDGTGIELMESLHSKYGLRSIKLTGYGMEDGLRCSGGSRVY